MATSSTDFLQGISAHDREELRLYSNEFWTKYLNDIALKLIEHDPELKAFYKKNPIPWLITEEPDILGAFFMPEKPHSKSFFRITRGLLRMLDNEDQLALIMGHELEHYYQEMKAKQTKKRKSPIALPTEETLADIKGMQRLGMAGYNIDAAFSILLKLRKLAETAEAEAKKRASKEGVEEAYKELKKIRELEQLLTDPHLDTNSRQSLNEGSTISVRNKLAGGAYGGQEVDASAAAVHTWGKESEFEKERHRTEYISYVDKKFKDAHFDAMSTDEKNAFLVDMCIEISQGSSRVRGIDFTKHAWAYLESLKEEMEGWSREEKERRFADGSAPAMSLIAKFLEVAMFKNPLSGERQIEQMDNLYFDTLGHAFSLWPETVAFKNNAPFWQQLRKEIDLRIKRGQQKAKKKSPLTEDEEKEDEADCKFIRRLNNLCTPRDARPVESLGQRWTDLPHWDNLELGDRRPTHWLWTPSVTRFTSVNQDRRIHPLAKEKYDEFIQNHNRSVCASSISDAPDSQGKTSRTIDRIWPSWDDFEKWQEEEVRKHLHQEIAQELHDLKQQADQYIQEDAVPPEKGSELSRDNFFGDIYEFADKLFPLIPQAVGQKQARAWELDPTLYPTFQDKYLPKIWGDNDFKKRLSPMKFDRDLLLSLMAPEDAEFFTHPSKEYADKLVDACIRRIGKKKVTPFERKKKYYEKDFWVFPEVYNRSAKAIPVFLPDQEEKIVNAYVQKAPPAPENVSSNAELMRAYISLLGYYYYKHDLDVTHDFSDFKTPIPEYILKCLNLPPLTHENAAVWEEFVRKNKKKEYALTAAQCVVFDAILRNNKEDLPFDLLRKVFMPEGFSSFLAYVPHDARLIFTHKMRKLFSNPKNYPATLSDFTKFIRSLNRCGETAVAPIIGYKIRHDFQTPDYEIRENKESDEIYKTIQTQLAQYIQKELDPKKIEEAWLVNGDYFSLSAPHAKVYDETVLPLFLNSRIWQQDIKSKVAFFVKVPTHLWGSEISKRDHLIDSLLTEIQQVKNPKTREGLLFEFLKKNGRISNPELADRAHHLWAKSVADIMGKPDDESDAYFDKIKPYIDKVKRTAKRGYREEEANTVTKTDSNRILRYLEDETVSQRRLSQAMKPAPISLTDQSYWEETKENIGLMSIGGLGYYLHKHPERRDDLISFLRSQGTVEDCERIRELFKPEIKTIGAYVGDIRMQYQLSIPRIQQQYKAFWAADPNVQMLIIDDILKNTTEKPTADAPLWEQNFDYVANQIFPGNDKRSRMLKSALHAYIECRPESDRNFALAKLLVSAGTKSDKEGAEETNQKIGKGIKAFLESIGPAGIKLGQALRALPDIPDYVRDNLKDFMSHAAPPARHEVYDWIDIYKKQNPREAHTLDSLKIGRLVGSASFFVTLLSGEKDVVKIMRMAAKIGAEQEMGYIHATLEKLMNSKEQLLGDLGPTLLRTVEQAQDSIADETDLKIGERQYKIAEKLYPESVDVNGYHFNVREAKWHEHGKKWARMEKMPGVEVDQIEDPNYRKAASIAYVSTELLNIFSGRRFDWDRHMGQMKLDPKTNTLGLFDTGSMMLHAPTPEDQQALGTILYRTLESALSGPEPKNFAKAFTEEIDRFYKEAKQPSAYITQVQRGLLALSGYYKDFTAADFAQCIDIAFNNYRVNVSKHIMSAFVGEMLGKTGLLQRKDDSKQVPEEVATEKEDLGRLLFNLYAAAQISNSEDSIGKILEEESQSTSKVKVPTLGRLFFKKRHMTKNFDSIKIPGCFGTHIVEALKDKQIDPIIAKGMMKEGFASVCLVDKNHRDTPEVKKELGKQLHSIFISARKKGKTQEDIINEAQQRLQDLAPKSVLARNLLALLSLSKYSSSTKNIDIKEVVWEVISQEDLDQNILQGMHASMKEKGHVLSSLALRFRKPLSKIRKIRSVFSLFKKDTTPQQGYLKTLLENAVTEVVALPERVAIKRTSKGSLLTLLAHSSKKEGVVLAPLAKKNKSISYKKREASLAKPK